MSKKHSFVKLDQDYIINLAQVAFVDMKDESLVVHFTSGGAVALEGDQAKAFLWAFQKRHTPDLVGEFKAHLFRLEYIRAFEEFKQEFFQKLGQDSKTEQMIDNFHFWLVEVAPTSTLPDILTFNQYRAWETEQAQTEKQAD